MSRRPRLHPRSPVQNGGSSGALPILLLVPLLALILWGWQQDWTEDKPQEQQVTEAGSARPSAADQQQTPSAQPPVQRAQASLPSYFTDDDYPAAAIRKGEQGTVAFILSVSPEGRVTGCRLAESSGSSILDTTTCRILKSRVRFQPARDNGGQAVGDEVHGRIKWVLPQA